MSRVGKHPVEVPGGVDVAVEGGLVRAKGKLGDLSYEATDDVSVALEDGKVVVRPANEGRRARAMWGTARSRIQAMVTGVSEGFTKQLGLHQAAGDQRRGIPRRGAGPDADPAARIQP
jgi:large subunit ribosomal protein L6